MARGSGDVVAAFADGFGHAGVRGFAGVEADGAGGVAIDLVREVGVFDEVTEDVFARGGAADVAHTNEDKIITVFHEINVRRVVVPLTGKEL